MIYKAIIKNDLVAKFLQEMSYGLIDHLIISTDYQEFYTIFDIDCKGGDLYWVQLIETQLNNGT